MKALSRGWLGTMLFVFMSCGGGEVATQRVDVDVLPVDEDVATGTDGVDGEAPGGSDLDSDVASDLAVDDVLNDDTSLDAAADAEIWEAGPEEIEGSATVPRFDPIYDNLLLRPWPSDAYRTFEGHLDFAFFPNPEASLVLQKYVDYAAANLDGFSMVQVVYFPLWGDIDPASLPATYVPADASQPIQIVDVTPGSSALGTRIPLSWQYRSHAGKFLPENILMMRPLWGFTLQEGHTYAAILTSALQGIDGIGLGRPSAFSAMLAGTYGEEAFNDAMQPLRDYLQNEPELMARIAAATVFTVARPTEELRRIRDYLRHDVSTADLKILDFGYMGSTSTYRFYEGHYQAPNFCRGTPPYASEGGGFEFYAANDKPVVQTTETMRFALTVPRDQEMPEGGWPIVLQSHGTGGDYKSFIEGGVHRIAFMLSGMGLANVGIDQPLHGARVDPPLGDTQLSLYSFNMLNPEAGRSVQRQSVADEIYLMRLVEAGALTIPAAVSADAREERFDATRIMFFGHSQGGITGGMLLALEDRLRGGLLSAAGAGMSNTLMLRKDPADMQMLLTALMGIEDPTELDEYHPIVTLIQMITDVTDPASYAGGYFAYDATDPEAGPRSVMVTEGLLDQFTPPFTTETLMAEAAIPILAPALHWPLAMTVRGLSEAMLPLESNIEAAGGRRATAFGYQIPDQGHFATTRDLTTVRYYQQFFRTLGYDGTARVEPVLP